MPKPSPSSSRNRLIFFRKVGARLRAMDRRLPPPTQGVSPSPAGVPRAVALAKAGYGYHVRCATAQLIPTSCEFLTAGSRERQRVVFRLSSKDHETLVSGISAREPRTHRGQHERAFSLQAWSSSRFCFGSKQVSFSFATNTHPADAPNWNPETTAMPSRKSGRQ